MGLRGTNHRPPFVRLYENRLCEAGQRLQGTTKEMDAVTELDGKLLLWIQDTFTSEWLTPIMKLFTGFGEYGIFAIALCLILLAFGKTRRLGIICSFALAFTFLCCNGILKPLVDRPRPWEIVADVVHHLAHPGDASFPSGHSANTMGAAWAMFLATAPVKSLSGGVRTYDGTGPLGWRGVNAPPKPLHRASVAAVILAVLVGFSRLYLGMHFPSDVIVGLILGMLCATAVYLAVGKYEAKHGIIGEKKNAQTE